MTLLQLFDNVALPCDFEIVDNEKRNRVFYLEAKDLQVVGLYAEAGTLFIEVIKEN